MDRSKDRPLPSPARLPRGGQVALGVGESWLDFERLFEVADRLVEPALDAERDAEVVVRLRRLRRLFQRRPEGDDRFFRPIELEEEAAEIVGRGAGRIEPRGAAELVDRAVVLLCRGQRVGEVAM